MATGVFSLRKVYIRQYQNVDNRNFASWPEGATYGYYGGGYAAVSTISRLEFSNETVSDPGKNLPAASRELAATSSSSYGYFGGGFAPPLFLNTITRLDFSNETTSLPNNNLLALTRLLSGVSSSSYGYFGGGQTPVSTVINTITRLDFSSETISNPTKNLLSINSNLAATSNNSYGYFGGGYTPPSAVGLAAYVCTITRLDFSNETISNPGKNLLQGRSDLGGGATSISSYGYFGGGLVSGSIVNTISRLDFSNETTSDPGRNLLTTRYSSAATSSSSYGYFGGGFSPASISIITRLDFSNETVSNSPTRNLPTARGSLTGLSGGQSVFRRQGGGSKTYGYWGGGILPTPPSTRYSTIDRLDFSTETLATPTFKLSRINQGLAATSNNYYGYFGGGFTPISPVPSGYLSTVDRLDFSNESVSTLTPKLYVGRYTLAATSSSSYGYFGGGYYPNQNYDCTLNRLDFSNETITIPTSVLSEGKSLLTALSNSSYGYFAGGFNAVIGLAFMCTINRLDFSTETVTTPTSTKLSEPKNAVGATSNNSYGYFGGGDNNVPVRVCTINRLDFSTEIVTTPTPMLSFARSALGVASSSSYGYFGGGYVPSAVSIIDRLDFVTETVTTPITKLSQSKAYLAAVSNAN